MDETLWNLFWTTGLPEVYSLAKEAGEENVMERYVGRDDPNAPH